MTRPLDLGHELDVRLVEATRFALDGGAMFGIVPRVLWEKAAPPDSQHRIALAARVMLVRRTDSPGAMLVDVGLGDAWSEKERRIYAIDGDGRDLERALGSLGVAADAVTDVVLTHLHWDHAGGVVRQDAGRKGLSFPHARHHVAAAHLAHARTTRGKDEGSFRLGDLALLEEADGLVVHEAYDEWLPGIFAHRSDGHTEGLAVVEVRGSRRSAFFPGDLLPTRHHARPGWNMAYDNQPMRIGEEKTLLLSRGAERGDVIVLEHDPDMGAATVHHAGHGRFELRSAD